VSRDSSTTTTSTSTSTSNIGSIVSATPLAPFQDALHELVHACSNLVLALVMCIHRDPFFWIAKNDGAVSYHVVLHNNPRGVHFFSPDGLNWQLQQKLDEKGNPQPPHFFTENIHQTDGSTITCGNCCPPIILGLAHFAS
jgi:hypothetical protein